MRGSARAIIGALAGLTMALGAGAQQGDLLPTLLITGDDHPAHRWKETTPAIVAALNSGTSRFKITVSEDAEILASKELFSFKLIVLNYCNWTRPGLSDSAKKNFVAFLNGGGGLTIVHFSDGAFHFSLPKQPGSDWPEYRTICRRVWDHTPGKSRHDPYGSFRVDIVDRESPITQGLQSFETTDELYFDQQGDLPIHVLATARSKVSGKDEPMVFTYNYGKARVFQTLLGHSAAAIATPGAAQLLRNGSLWAANLRP